MNTDEAKADFIAMNSRMKRTKEIWEQLRSSLRDLATDWRLANKNLKDTSIEYLPEVDPEITEQKDLIKIGLKNVSATFRLNDPLGHISATFRRETSFGADTVLVLYSTETTERNTPRLIRIDDDRITNCLLEDVILTTRLNLLMPKVLPRRVCTAMAAMNAS